MTHNSEKLFFEYLAKLILETFLPNEYYNLIISDKPDLRMGKDHGIEVTRALYENEGQAASVFQHIRMQSKKQVDQRYLQTMKRTGFDVIEIDGVIGGYSPMEAVWINADLLKSTFNKKMEKADGYPLLSVDLFIYSPMSEWFEEKVVLEFMEWTNDNGGSSFSKIIVFEMPYIYTYSSKNNSYSKISINHEQFRNCVVKAREIAHNAEQRDS